MERTGNFLGQPNGNFPLDCETLDMMQRQAALSAAVGNIAGQRVILTGCEKAGARRTGGYVFVATRQYPEGEVLPFTGGAEADGLHLAVADEAVRAQGYDFPKAYTTRRLEPGVGEESWSWEDFARPVPARETEERMRALEEAVEEARAAAGGSGDLPGTVKMWAGTGVPDGYLLCDGQALPIEGAYQALYEAIGTTYNNAPDRNDSQYTTPSGQFRVPDLSGRFVVGLAANDPDYNRSRYGAARFAGGTKKVTLSEAEMPKHAHRFTDDTNAEGKYPAVEQRFPIKDGTITGEKSSADSSGAGCVYFSETRGGGMAHENRPPYYVMSYIIKY